MAGIGVSKPYYAAYTNTSGTITYGTAAAMGLATSCSISLNDGGDNILYADNGPAEVANKFSGGTVSFGIDHLSLDVAGDLLGPTVTTDNTTGIKSMTYKDGDVAPYMGVGIVQKVQKGNTVSYSIYVLYKVQFKLPGADMTTEGDTISWQTPTLEAEILRDDSSDHKWGYQASGFATEAAAVSAIAAALPTS